MSEIGNSWERVLRTQGGQILVEKTDGNDLVLPSKAARDMVSKLSDEDRRKSLLQKALTSLNF